MSYECKDVKREIKSFKDGIRQLKKNDSKKPCELNSVEDPISIKSAVDLAYNDAKRTMDGIGKFENEKNSALDQIKKKIEQYFSNNSSLSKDDFDQFHHELCKIWCESFNNNIGTYGKAQKIVNMTFKYLRCCNDASTHKDCFCHCHMPLDSFTLEWFKRRVAPYLDKKDFVKGKMISWSNLEYGSCDYFQKDNKEYYSYKYYLVHIRDYVNNTYPRLTPLELEFIEWPRMQREIDAETFLFALKDDLSSQEKNEIKKESLNTKYERIIKVLKEKL
jgi:hypothetical protein